MILKNAEIYDKEFNIVKADVSVKGERISGIGSDITDTEILDLEGLTILPGFIDIHIHGCANADTGDASAESLEKMSNFLVKHGVTSFCPTSMTLSFEELSKIFSVTREVKDSVSGAYIQGMNMEGPYISMAKKGSQNPAYVRNPNAAEFMKLYNGCGGFIKLVDIAPECEGAKEFIETVLPYCTVSTAHTSAGYDEACKAIEWGVRHTTHLYNAQSGLTHRAPGVVGAVFDNARKLGVRAELICDGFHIHPAALRIAFFMLGEDNSIIVSDSMKAAGCPDGTYELGMQPVYVKDGKALLEDGTIAASTSNVYDEFKNVISYGIPMKQAVKSVTINPAKAIRADKDTGSIETGKYADMVVLDKNLNIKLVMVKGTVKVNNL
ncbi:MAG: N-acetylglucosamine-6-phosphate deacetylase [Eubacteriales bacterium]